MRKHRIGESTKATAPYFGNDRAHWRPLVRLTATQLRGNLWKTVLGIVISALFPLMLGFMSNTIKVNAMETERLYNETVVDMGIYKRMSSTTSGNFGGGYILPETVEAINNSGFVQAPYLEATALARYVSPRPNLETEEIEIVNAALRAATDLAQVISTYDLVVTFTDGWNLQSFLATTGDEKAAIPLVLPLDTAVTYQMKFEEVFTVNNLDCMVVGYYISNDPSIHFENYLVSMDNLRLLSDREYAYDRAEFTINPAKNRELDALYALTDSLVETGGIQPLHFQYWDEELTSVVRPLEQSLQLLNILYPVVMVVSILVAIGLQVILLIQQLCTAALLRVLGVPVSQTGGVLTLLQLPAVVLGLVLGLGILLILYRTCDPVYAAMYLGGSLAGILLGLIRMAKQQPLELLQVKE